MLLMILLASSPLQTVQDGAKEFQKVASVEQLTTRADEVIDFAEMTRRALGPQWEKLSPAQQAELSATLKGLLEASYAKRAFGQRGGREPLKWDGEKISGNEAIVSSSVMLADDKLPIECRLHKVGSGWKIYDVVADGASLVDAYADQFRPLLAKSGYDALMEKMKARKAKLEAAK